MFLLSFARWVQATDLFSAIRMSWYVYPSIMALHLIGIAVFGGMILMSNLRLLGVALRNEPVSDVIDQLRVPKRIGFGVVATCGVLLAGSKAEEYYYNPFFWTKMSLLASIALHGLIFRGSVYRKVGEFDRLKKLPGNVKLAAGLSLLLWTGVACAGRGIGYIDPPLDKLHAENHASDRTTVARRPPAIRYRPPEDRLAPRFHRPRPQATCCVVGERKVGTPTMSFEKMR